MFWKGGDGVNISEIGVDKSGFVDSGASSGHRAITIFFFLIHVCQLQMFIDQSSHGFVKNYSFEIYIFSLESLKWHL